MEKNSTNGFLTSAKSWIYFVRTIRNQLVLVYGNEKIFPPGSEWFSLDARFDLSPLLLLELHSFIGSTIALVNRIAKPIQFRCISKRQILAFPRYASVQFDVCISTTVHNLIIRWIHIPLLQPCHINRDPWQINYIDSVLHICMYVCTYVYKRHIIIERSKINT